MLAQEQVDCPVTHNFGPGVYMREVFIPKDTLALGHHQNFDHACVFIKGKLTLFTQDGERRELQAPMSFTAKPGRKLVYTHEDCIFMNVYPTTETDVEKLEAHFLNKSEYSIEDKKRINRALLLTNADVEIEIKELEINATPLPPGSYKLKIGFSQTINDACGVIATANIEEGELLAPAIFKGKKTVVGKFLRRSNNPNAKLVKLSDEDTALVSIKNIRGCQGGRDGEEITIGGV